MKKMLWFTYMEDDGLVVYIASNLLGDLCMILEMPFILKTLSFLCGFESFFLNAFKAS